MNKNKAADQSRFCASDVENGRISELIDAPLIRRRKNLSFFLEKQKLVKNKSLLLFDFKTFYKRKIYKRNKKKEKKGFPKRFWSSHSRFPVCRII